MSAWSCVDSGAVAAALGEELGAWSGAEGVRGLRGVGPAGRVEPSRCSTITRCLPRQPHGSGRKGTPKRSRAKGRLPHPCRIATGLGSPSNWTRTKPWSLPVTSP